MAASTDAEPATSISLPKIAFDALRVESASVFANGAATLRSRNLPTWRKHCSWKAGSSKTISFDSRFPASAVVDGIQNSAGSSESGIGSHRTGRMLGSKFRSLRELPQPAEPFSCPICRPLRSRCTPERRLTRRNPRRWRSVGSRLVHASSGKRPGEASAFASSKKYQTLSGVAAIGDSVGIRSVTPLTFRIVGDGKGLWRTTMQEVKSKESFSIDISRVAKLELYIDCPGSVIAAHAIWVDLKLTRAGATPTDKK